MTTKTDATFSPREAAKHIGVSHQTVYNWIQDGLPVVWVGLKKRLRSADIHRWLDAQRKKRA